MTKTLRRKKEVFFCLFTVLWIPHLALSQTNESDHHCADVVGAIATPTSPNTFTVSATVSSPYETGWDQYADAWQIVVADDDDETAVGVILGTRLLGHPHVNEQPFTRTLSGVEISYGTVVIRARDSINGYCGETYVLQVDGVVEQKQAETNTTTTTANVSNTNNESSTTQRLDEPVDIMRLDDSGTDMFVGMAASVLLAFTFLYHF